MCWNTCEDPHLVSSKGSIHSNYHFDGDYPWWSPSRSFNSSICWTFSNEFPLHVFLPRTLLITQYPFSFDPPLLSSLDPLTHDSFFLWNLDFQQVHFPAISNFSSLRAIASSCSLGITLSCLPHKLSSHTCSVSPDCVLMLGTPMSWFCNTYSVVPHSTNVSSLPPWLTYLICNWQRLFPPVIIVSPMHGQGSHFYGAVCGRCSSWLRPPGGRMVPPT